MIKVFLADDHTILRDGLKQILADTDDIEVVGEAADGLEAVKKIQSMEVDVLVMDMSMPGRSGLELLKQIKSIKPKLPILILSMHSEDQYAVRSYRAGAAGYLTKDSASMLLVSAIRKIAQGGIFISPDSAERMALQFNAAREENNEPHTTLSNREFQIFQLLIEGKGLTEIATQLALSVKTVSTHKTHVLEKMQMNNTAELIRYAMKHNLIAQS